MIRAFKNASLFTVLVLIGSCSQNEVLFPVRPALPANTVPVYGGQLKAMEGIYKLSSGSEGLGTEFVCKASRFKVSFFSDNQGASLILDAGLDPTDSTLYFAGYWRFAESPTQSTVFFKITKDQGAHSILADSVPVGTILDGYFFSNQTQFDLKVSYDRDYSQTVKNFLATRGPFTIFGHHGIQTNANPPFLENSMQAVLHCEEYGTTGIEVDVRLTKDNVPILIHDPDINLRVTLKNGILGDVDEFNYQTLYNFVRLRDGQRIPTVEAALAAAIDSTNLAYVWLDIKGNTDVFKYLEPIVRGAISHANAVGRNITIISDMPSDAVIDEFKKQPSYADLPLMCELELQTTIDLGCKYWGPRFTEGTLNSDVARAHSLGIDAYSWTLNSPVFIDDFLKDGDFDGMITDYPAYIVYKFYTKP